LLPPLLFKSVLTRHLDLRRQIRSNQKTKDEWDNNHENFKVNGENQIKHKTFKQAFKASHFIHTNLTTFLSFSNVARGKFRRRNNKPRQHQNLIKFRFSLKFSVFDFFGE